MNPGAAAAANPVRLWRSILNPRGPNYAFLAQIFGQGSVPLKSPRPHKADLGPEKDVEVYLLDLQALPLTKRAWLLGIMAQRFDVPIYEISAASKQGFPIRACDVTVSFDMRAFV